MAALEKSLLTFLYVIQKKSSKDISIALACSENKVNYWLAKHSIKKRSIAEAVYNKANPKGDPFCFRKPSSVDDAFLYGLGIGLYWGEGTKADNHSVRLGNTDPRLIKKFLEFLVHIYHIRQDKLRFGLQLFSDVSKRQALKFWVDVLGVQESQFMKVVVTPKRGIGTYRHKNKHGVLTVYFSNKKLRDIICDTIKKL